MPHVSVDGARIYVETAGAGPPLVLLHGFTGNAGTWKPLIPELARRHLTVAIDLLGHGRSDAPVDPRRYGIAHCIEDILGVLDRLGLHRATLLGYSMGGRAALAVAGAAPERMSALILESASPGLRDPEVRLARAARDALLADAIEREGVAAFIDQWERQPLFASQSALPDAVRTAVRAQRLQSSPTGLANSLRGFGQGVMMPLHDFLAEIRIPTLIMAGALDSHYCEVGREMQRHMPGASLRIVDGAGHAIHLEQPGTFCQQVADFLTSIYHTLS